MSLSQLSAGSGDMDDLFAQISTQVFNPSPRKPGSGSSGTIVATSSSSTLGKRSASDIESPRPAKAFKQADDDDDNPFIEKRDREPFKFDVNEPYLIVHSHVHQKCFGSRRIPYGAQYEIARLVNLGRFGFAGIEIQKLDKLSKLSNADGALKARSIFMEKEIPPLLRQGNPKQVESPWTELDKEEAAVQKHGATALLGFVNSSGSESDWFGGKVIFRANLKYSGPAEKPTFKITLAPAELGPSCRFSRRFGSTSLLRFKIPKSLRMSAAYRPHLVDFLKKPFLLLGSVYRAFYAKDGNVFLFQTNEALEPNGTISQTHTVPGRLSLLQLIEWHNPLALNGKQLLSKWSTRFQLGLSSSVPGIVLGEDCILEIEDIVSDSRSDMTDGAGLINRAGLLLLHQKFKWNSWPTAVQVRIQGAKGLLVNHPNNDETTPKVWLRPSQMKIKHPDGADETAYRIIDVLQTCHSRPTCRLSIETIINLSANHVPNKIFKALLKRSLDDIVRMLTDWTDTKELWKTVSRLGKVFAARSARSNAALARLHGYKDRYTDTSDDQDSTSSESEEEDLEPPLDSGVDEQSGCPFGIEDAILLLLTAGFHPQECSTLRDKVDKLLRRTIDSYANKYHLDINMACTGFLVPDETGTLKPGELYFRSSQHNLPTEDGAKTDLLLGEVLLTRNPCKLPGDVQKWIAVDRPQLRHYTDVFVLPITGQRRAADHLAGGDYDGDKGTAIYDPLLVKPFVNAKDEDSKPPDDIDNNFISRDAETVNELVERHSFPYSDDEGLVQELQTYLLGNLGDSTVGDYSNFHTQAIYTRGYAHPETVRLAHLFCMTLDGAKTGVQVKPETWKKDRNDFGQGFLPWKGESDPTKNQRALRRPRNLGKFVMDYLAEHAKAEGDLVKAKLDKTFSDFRDTRDEDLIRPWEEAKARAKRAFLEDNNTRMQRDLDKISFHVEYMYRQYQKGVVASPRKSPTKGFPSEPRLVPEKFRDTLRKLSKEFASSPSPDEVLLADLDTLKASYAYYHDWESRQHSTSRWSNFPWHCAMRELCKIKACATSTSGNSAAVNDGFYLQFRLK